MSTIFIFIFWLISFAPAFHGQESQPRNRIISTKHNHYLAQKAWQNFNAKYGNKWRICWNERTGLPKKIFGYHTTTLTDSPEIATRSFIAKNKDFLGIVESNLKLEKIEPINKKTLIKFLQYYKNILVYKGKVIILLSTKNELLSLTADYYPNIDISIVPLITKEKAKTLAKEKVREEKDITNFKPYKNIVLCIFPFESSNGIEYHLVWVVPVLSIHPVFGKEYFVDAFTGDIIYEKSIILKRSFQKEPKK